jgi:hypothetical protein
LAQGAPKQRWRRSEDEPSELANSEIPSTESETTTEIKIIVSIFHSNFPIAVELTPSIQDYAAHSG